MCHEYAHCVLLYNIHSHKFVLCDVNDLACKLCRYNLHDIMISFVTTLSFMVVNYTFSNHVRNNFRTLIPSEISLWIILLSEIDLGLGPEAIFRGVVDKWGDKRPPWFFTNIYLKVQEKIGGRYFKLRF